jgi:arylsulfatase A-like enzyme
MPDVLRICLALVALGATAAAAEQPNIILCMADDQGWGDVSYNGHPVVKTPHLDAMAAAGLRFDRFYAAAPVCSPTRGSVMTGRTPNRFGCFKWGHTLRPQEITIAEALKPAGYATGHFGKWHLGSMQKTSPVNPGASGFDRWLSAYNFYDNDPILSREGIATPLKGESSQIAAEAAIEFIREQHQGQKPFLAVVWFGSPHGPHRASNEDRAAYAAHGNKADFYGELAGLDRAVGQLRAELRRLKIERDTLFWYCSDNGGLPNLGVTGGRANKASIYEGGLRVPGIIEWPARIAQPRVTNVPACTFDIYPTLLEIVGVKPDKQPPLDGISLVPLIDGRMTERQKPLGFWDHPTPGVGTPSAQWMAELLEAQTAGDELGNRDRLWLDAGQIKQQYPEDNFPGHSAWLAWPWKLHRIERGNQPVKFELYNLADDPLEASDLLAKQGERSTEMRRELEEWLESVARSLNGKDYVTR